MDRTTIRHRLPSAKLVEEILDARPRGVPRDLAKHSVTHEAPGRIELHLSPVVWGLGPDATNAAHHRAWSKLARRIEACGGTWRECRGSTGTRFVSLPLPFTDEARSLYLTLLEVCGDFGRTGLVVRPEGDSLVWHVRSPQARHGTTAPPLADLHAEWLRAADSADGVVRGRWQASREREYDAREREDATRLGRLEREHAQVLAHLADVEAKLAAERERLAAKRAR